LLVAHHLLVPEEMLNEVQTVILSSTRLSMYKENQLKNHQKEYESIPAFEVIK
jgi:hypothetical protein